MQKHTTFKNKLLLVGFGAIGKGVLPLLLRHIDMPAENITILTKKNAGSELAKEYGVTFVVEEITKENHRELLPRYVQSGDCILNLSVDVSSAALVTYCQENAILYLDTCIEPWEGGYYDAELSSSDRSCYAMREQMLALKSLYPAKTATALIAHGANPGLVSHFVKQALLNIARDTGSTTPVPKTRNEWATLAKELSIKVIHIAERDTQNTNLARSKDEFVNTWSIDGFVSEGCQPAELGWGSHEKHWPEDGCHHNFGSRCAIYLNRPGATTFVRTWTPLSGPFHGYLMTHTEAISISDYFTLKDGEPKDGDKVRYRPTVHFAYHPCEDAVLSMDEFVGREWSQQSQQRILYDEIVEGTDELGVLLMGHKKGAYWFGSQLSIEEARKLAPLNNATSLQVAVGALAGLIWAMENPECGIVEPDEIDYAYVLKIASPYLGTVAGHYTNWTPLDNREKYFPEKLDRADPWQFINVRVN
ncbi:MAG: homospermidine synthase [Verrucomicrobia bacterium]|nr:homospermidine synthase [Verrucomicrobiota bacterium]MBS0636945.1 homospermidine synthase [Verrucomicrobiota bacterium]